MKTLTAIEMIESIEKRIAEMQNKAYYETDENDFESQLNIYLSHMTQISAELSVLKDLENGADVSKK